VGDAPESFRRGVELYARGELFEAHEAWEELWRAAEPGSADAALLQGLIQCAAAGVKLDSGHRNARAAARRIAERALGHLERAHAEGADTRGLDLSRFIGELRAWIAAGPGPIAERPRISLDD
jgi:predicted metal-dependent hydrolase